MPVSEEQGGLGRLSHNSADNIDWDSYNNWWYTEKERVNIWGRIVAKAISMKLGSSGGNSSGGNGGSTNSTHQTNTSQGSCVSNGDDPDLERVESINDALSQRFTDLYAYSTSKKFEVGFLIGKENGIFKEAEHSYEEGSVDYPYVFLDATIKDQNATLEGEFHTHPESMSGKQGLGFSGEDIFYLSTNYKTGLKKGFVSIVDAGSARFALIITNEKDARSIMNRSNNETNKDRFNALVDKYGNNSPESYKKAIVEMFGSPAKSGIQFYISTDKKHFSKIN